MRKKHSSSFKAKVVLEILKEEKTISELAAEYNLPHLFSDGARNVESIRAGYEKKLDELYAEIGRLTTQLTWLKKKVSTLSRAQRIALLDWHYAELRWQPRRNFWV